MVGYQELATLEVGKVMVAPTFLNIGESNKVSLVDLKVTGYDAPEEDGKGGWIGGCTGGEFAMQQLNRNGIPDATYYWIDDGENTAGWYASVSAAPISGGAAKVKIDSATSFWTQGSKYKLVPAGAVNPNDVVVQTLEVGKVAVGNCFPVELKLTDLTVTGYDAPEEDGKGGWIGGCTGGEFAMQQLNRNGIPDATYYWIDDGENNAGWYASVSAAPIQGGAANVKVPAGQGYWTQGSKYKQIIPAPELDNK